jgi:hypothetical protein
VNYHQIDRTCDENGDYLAGTLGVQKEPGKALFFKVTKSNVTRAGHLYSIPDGK